MTTARWTALALATAALIGSAWLAWRWLDTPVPPDFPTAQMEPAVADMIGDALANVRREPRSGAAWGRLALAASANGFSDEALLCVERAETLDATNPRWPYLHGHLLQDGRSGDPLPYWRQALTRSQSGEHRGAALFRLTLALIETMQLDEAGEHLRELEELEGAGERVRLGGGLLALAHDDLAGARGHLMQALGSPHARKLAARNLATIAIAEGDAALARFYQQRAEGLPADAPWPDAFVDELNSLAVNRDARVREATRLDNTGRLPEAVTLLRGIVATTPDASAYLALGIALTKLHRFPDAEDALNTALRLDPKQMRAHHFLATIRFIQAEDAAKSGNAARAKELFTAVVAGEDSALAIKAFDPYAHMTRGTALRRLGRTEEALAALRAAVNCRPGLAETHLALGEALAEAGRLPEALTQLTDAVRFATPDDRRPREALDKWQGRARQREAK